MQKKIRFLGDILTTGCKTCI